MSYDKLPFRAYEGDEPYIFINYKHKDEDMVYPVIKQFHDMGFNVWYDEGGALGTNYEIQIAKQIEGSALFVNFITRTAMDCANDAEDYMRRELSLAIDLNKMIIPIYLEEVELKGYYRFHLMGRHSIFKFEFGDDEDLFYKACSDVFVNDFGIKPMNMGIESPNAKPMGLDESTRGKDPRLSSEHLMEFEKLNTTTDSIFDLEWHDVLIILKDGSNLTSWSDVEDRQDVIYVSENLSSCGDLTQRYKDLKSLKSIVASGVSYRATTMEEMFWGCESLVDLVGFNDWDVSNVKDMSLMFIGCESLADFSALKNWDVSGVENMWGMFGACSSLSDLSFLSGWDVSGVENMWAMFGGCSSLSDLSALAGWDVSHVTTMGAMFNSCESLEDLSALSSWNVSNVTVMESMFGGCSSLMDIFALRNWDVSGVVDMGFMFSDCKSLSDVFPLRRWDVYNAKDMESMFWGCESLEDLSVFGNWDAPDAEKRNIFENCQSIRILPSGNDKSKATLSGKNHFDDDKDGKTEEYFTKENMR